MKMIIKCGELNISAIGNNLVLEGDNRLTSVLKLFSLQVFIYIVQNSKCTKEDKLKDSLLHLFSNHPVSPQNQCITCAFC